MCNLVIGRFVRVCPGIFSKIQYEARGVKSKLGVQNIHLSHQGPVDIILNITTSIVSTVDSLKMNNEPEIGDELARLSTGVGEQPSYGMETDDSPNVSASASSGNAKDTASKPIKGRKGVKMDAKITIAVEYEIHKNMVLHSLAARHFIFRQFWLFEVNQGFLTLCTSIFALLAAAELVSVSAENKKILTVTAGIVPLFVIFFQGLNSYCSYKTKGAMHESVALDLRDMRNNLRMLRTKLGFVEIYDLNTDATTNLAGEGNESEDYEQDTFESIQVKFEQSLSGCKSTIPIELNEAFDNLYHLGALMFLSKANMKHHADIYGPSFPSALIFIALDNILVTQISSYSLFPLCIPDGKTVSEKTMKIYHKFQAKNSKLDIDGTP